MDQALRRDRPVTLNVPDRRAIIRPEREAADAADREGLVGAYLVGPCRPLIARWASRRGLTPDTVMVFSLVSAVLAAVWFSAGTRGGLVTGALLLCVSLVLGRVDAGRPDWPAAVLDRVKEFVAYAGLAAGTAAHSANPWWAATGAVALLSVRHAIGGPAEANRSRPPDTVLRRAANSLTLPLGERFALIAVTGAVAGARLTFAVLLGWGTAAAAVTVTGRLRRSIT